MTIAEAMKGFFERPVKLTPTNPVSNETFEESNMAKLTISYHPGQGRSAKAEYRVGKTHIPTAVVSRLLRAKANNRQITMAIGKQYSEVLDCLDDAGIAYDAGLMQMAATRPVKAPVAGRTSSLARTAQLAARMICKRFRGTPEDMTDQFCKMVIMDEFKFQVTALIYEFEKSHGKNTAGQIKTSNRKANPAALKALARARSVKKKH